MRSRLLGLFKKIESAKNEFNFKTKTQVHEPKANLGHQRQMTELWVESVWR